MIPPIGVGYYATKLLFLVLRPFAFIGDHFGHLAVVRGRREMDAFEPEPPPHFRGIL